MIPSVNVSYILNIIHLLCIVFLYYILIWLKHILCEKNVIFANFVWKAERCRRTLAYIFQTNDILMKFWHVFHNGRTKHLQFTDFKYLEIWQIYRHIKIWTLFRTSNPDFGLFEVSDFKSGDQTCVEFSDSPKSGFFEALLRTIARASWYVRNENIHNLQVPLLRMNLREPKTNIAWNL